MHHWRLFSSMVFIATALPVTTLLYKSKLHWFIRISAAIPALALLCLAALSVQIASRCGDEPIYINSSHGNEEKSCG